MKAKFIVNPSLPTKKQNRKAGIDSVQTDMLMLTVMGSLGLGPSAKAIDKRLGGKLVENMKRQQFKGSSGQNLLLTLGEENPARNVLLVGLGSMGKFDFCAFKEVIDTAVEHAVSMKCKRLSLEIPKDRLTAGSVNIAGLANAIKGCVESKLKELVPNKKGTLEVELICTPQGATRLQSQNWIEAKSPFDASSCSPKGNQD